MKRRIRAAYRILSHCSSEIGRRSSDARAQARWRLGSVASAMLCVGVAVMCAAAIIRPFETRNENAPQLAAAISPALAPLASTQKQDKADRLLKPVQAASSGFTVQSVSGRTGEPMPLTIGLPRELPGSYAFLMFRGLPERFALSAGFRTLDHWVLSLNDVENVKLLPAPGYEGLFAVEVQLMRGHDVAAERRIMTVEITRPRPVPPATAGLPPVPPSNQLRATTAVEQTVPPPTVSRQAAPPPVAPAPQVTTPQPMTERDRSMLARADRLLREGDVAAARTLFSHLAQKGIAEGALAMARSYDPDTLVTLRVPGLEPDLAQAQAWYGRAEQLGSAQAASRLSALGSARR